MPTRILIAEDHQPTQELIREYLAREKKLQVVAATGDGAEAVALAQQHQPDIVLMDLSLKKMNGLEATKRIKKSCPAAEVIILTNYGFEDLRERARESPQMIQAAAFLTKREIPTRLVSVINELGKNKPTGAE